MSMISRSSQFRREKGFTSVVTTQPDQSSDRGKHERRWEPRERAQQPSWEIQGKLPRGVSDLTSRASRSKLHQEYREKGWLRQ